jgi:hypothetical protein
MQINVNKSFLALIVISIYFVLSGFEINNQKPIVIFDEGHGQKFVIEEKGPLHLYLLSSLFKQQGFIVTTKALQISDNTLNGADVLVISGAFISLNPSEIDAIMRFIDRGGKLCVMLHIGQPVAELLWRFNVLISNGVINEQENIINNNQKDFYVTRLESHPLTEGLKKFAIYGGWALMSSDKKGKVIAQTSPEAWIDLNGDQRFSEGDARQSFGVIVTGAYGKGRYIVFGDDAIFQNKFLQKDNLDLGKNLVRWLLSNAAVGKDTLMTFQLVVPNAFGISEKPEGLM